MSAQIERGKSGASSVCLPSLLAGECIAWAAVVTAAAATAGAGGAILQ